MKKLLTSALILLMLLTAAGCKGPADTLTDAVTTEAVSTAPTTTEAPPVPTVSITVPEGATLTQLAEDLERHSICTAADFMALANDKDFLSRLDYRILEGIELLEGTAFLLEGLALPDTYELYKNSSCEEVLKTILSNTDSKITAEHILRADELGYSIYEIITLASVIQCEASEVREMGKVSSVIHNRITSPDYGRLQCDVTIFYVNDFITDSPYLQGDTSRFAPLYNTYKCDGLPAGPICNPGLDAIEAALYPEQTDYFYFVTDEDWNYYYSETYSEHRERCKEVGLIG